MTRRRLPSVRHRRFAMILATALAWTLGLGPNVARAGVEPPSEPARVVVSGRADPRLAPFDRLMRDFLATHRIPGGALAVARNGRVVYARGFGYADLDAAEPVRPEALFRIASVSKPITAAAVLALVDRGKLGLDDRARDRLPPELQAIVPADARWDAVTVRRLLQHRAGFDRDRSVDPMFRSVAIARDLGVSPPAGPREVIRWMLGRPLDFDPGTQEHYSNFGYCVLGRLIEQAEGAPYEEAVRRLVLKPLGLTNRDIRLGRTLPALRAPGEVRYYGAGEGRSVFPPKVGEPVPRPYGGWNLEAMDAHGGWIASAPALVRLAVAFDRNAGSKVLSPKAIATAFERPPGAPAGAPVFYACGWQVREVGRGRINTWHTGSLDGTASLLVRRHDGLTWAVVFNTRDAPDRANLIGAIDPLLHRAADAVRNWPEGEP